VHFTEQGPGPATELNKHRVSLNQNDGVRYRPGSVNIYPCFSCDLTQYRDF